MSHAALLAAASPTLVASIIGATGGVMAALILAIGAWRTVSYRQLLKDIRDIVRSELETSRDRRRRNDDD